MMKKHCLTLMAVFAALALLLAACGGAPKTTEIVVTDNGWDSQKLHNEIAKYIVENAFDGYTLRATTGSTMMNWQALMSGEVDLDIEAWVENIATYPEDLSSGRVAIAGVLLSDSAQGFYVPRYVVEGDSEKGIEPIAPDLRHVRDIKNYGHLFGDPDDPSKGRIYGAIPGWVIDQILYDKYMHYGMDETFNYFRTGSESALFASLMSAYNLGDPWIGYCYEPTWIAGKLDLIRLEDEPYDPALFAEGKTEVPEQELLIMSNPGFKEKAPELVPFFENYYTGSELVNKALAHLDDTKASYPDAAKWFLSEFDYVLDEWLTADQAQRVRDALAGK